jgi:hypothetical protein
MMVTLHLTIEYNIFKGIYKNWIFIFIVVLIIAVQFLLVEFGGLAIKCAPLTWEQHGICIALGAGALPIGLLCKSIPGCCRRCCERVCICCYD